MQGWLAFRVFRTPHEKVNMPVDASQVQHLTFQTPIQAPEPFRPKRFRQKNP